MWHTKGYRDLSLHYGWSTHDPSPSYHLLQPRNSLSTCIQDALTSPKFFLCFQSLFNLILKAELRPYKLDLVRNFPSKCVFCCFFSLTRVSEQLHWEVFIFLRIFSFLLEKTDMKWFILRHCDPPVYYFVLLDWPKRTGSVQWNIEMYLSELSLMDVLVQVLSSGTV